MVTRQMTLHTSLTATSTELLPRPPFDHVEPLLRDRVERSTVGEEIRFRIQRRRDAR